MRSLLRLHRLLALVIAAQVIIWIVTGFYFSWLGHTDLAGEKYIGAQTQQRLSQPPAIRFATIAATYPNAVSISLNQIAGTPQYAVVLPSSRIYINADNGELWSTPLRSARALAQSAYVGPGRIIDERSVDLASVLPQQSGHGTAFTFDDSAQTVVYVNTSSAAVAGYGNQYSTLTDWMFRLHFMDYSGQRDFNNLWNRSLGLIFLFFCSSGLLIIVRQLTARRKQKKRVEQLTKQET